MKMAAAEMMTMMTECGRINSQRRLAATMEGVGAMMAVCSSDDGRVAVMMAGWGEKQCVTWCQVARNGAIKSINGNKKERRRACASAILGITK